MRTLVALLRIHSLHTLGNRRELIVTEIAVAVDPDTAYVRLGNDLKSTSKIILRSVAMYQRYELRRLIAQNGCCLGKL